MKRLQYIAHLRTWRRATYDIHAVENERTRQWRARNKEKVRAHNIYQNARYAGRVTPATMCEACGASGHIHAHHDDYSRPLDVRYLCASCHKRHHLRLAAAARRPAVERAA
jgi:hypothetical protein